MVYKWEGMIKISCEEAIERFNSDKEVFLLYDDDSEAHVVEEYEIPKHEKNGGEFGYEKSVL